jgi:hypothetical protein
MTLQQCSSTATLREASGSDASSQGRKRTKRPGRRESPRRGQGRIHFDRLEERTLLAINLTGVPSWVEQGPGPIDNGSVIGMESLRNPVVGAIEAVVAHPTDARVLYVGSVNGGIWRTLNATETRPNWTPLTDEYASLGTGALAMVPGDTTPLDPSDDILYVGTARFSASRQGQFAAGVLKTIDGGQTWKLLGEETFRFFGIRSVIATPNDQVVLAATHDGVFTGTESHRGGLYRSTDGGANWVRVSGATGTVSGVDFTGNQLPDAGISHVVAGQSGEFFAAVPGKRGSESVTGRGIYRSTDNGQTWLNVSDNLPASILDSSTRIELAASPVDDPLDGHAVFVSVVDTNRQISGVFRGVIVTGNMIWTRIMNLPQPLPTQSPSGGTRSPQGDLHSAILADPNDSHIVYVAGDIKGPFRGDSRTNQWTELAGVNGGGTRPHGDFRDMVFDANLSNPLQRDLIAVDDGGIYRLHRPNDPVRNWQPLHGDLRITEIATVAYDPIRQVILAGTQDNGSIEQTALGNPEWTTQFTARRNGVDLFATGDGGTQVADPANRTVYEMQNDFRSFFRRTFDTNNNLVDSMPPGGPCTSTFETPGSGLDFLAAPVMLAQPGNPCGHLSGLTPADRNNRSYHVRPFVLNPLPGRSNQMLLGDTALYESFDGGNTIRNITPPDLGGDIRAIAYSGSLLKPSLAYAAAAFDLFLRDGGPNTPFRVSTLFREVNSANVQSIAVDPSNFRTVYVATDRAVFRGTDLGLATEAWQDLAEPLRRLLQIDQTPGNQLGFFRTVKIIQIPSSGSTQPHDVLLVGGVGGVYRLIDPNSNTAWTKFGQGLPNVSITSLDYNEQDNLLVAGTLGRGVWTIPNARQQLATPAILTIDGDDIEDDQVMLRRDANRRGVLKVTLTNSSRSEGGEFPLTAIERIDVNGFGGQDELRIDSTRGVIEVPGLIHYNGGDSIDLLLYTLASGDTFVTAPSLELFSGVSRVEGSLGSSEGQWVHYDDVEFVPLSLFPLTEAEQVSTIGNGLESIVQQWSQLFPQDIPVVGRTLDDVLAGAVAAGRPVTDSSGDILGAAVGSAGISVSSTPLRRLFETGHGAFPLSEIGRSITTLAALRNVIDGLDEVADNVSMFENSDGVLFDVEVRKSLTGLASLDLRGLLGAVDVDGHAEVTADVTLHLVFGTDARGFFIEAERNPDPEVTVGNLRITGDAAGTGRLGLTDVSLTAAQFGRNTDRRLTGAGGRSAHLRI